MTTRPVTDYGLVEMSTAFIAEVIAHAVDGDGTPRMPANERHMVRLEAMAYMVWAAQLTVAPHDDAISIIDTARQLLEDPTIRERFSIETWGEHVSQLLPRG